MTVSSHSTRKPRRWQERFPIAAFFLILTLIDFWPQLVNGRVLYWGDIGLYFTPMTTFLHAQLRAGRLPLWNPGLLCGTPFVGNPQAWPFYPATLLLPIVSAAYFLSLSVALHVWLAAYGTYVFLHRAQQLSRSASVLGAVVFAFGGQLVSKEQFPNMVQAIAWLPLILYALHELTEHWRTGDALLLGLWVGLQLLGAHTQMTLLTLYLAAAYGTLRLRQTRPPLRRIGLRLVQAACIAAGLCAVQVLPVMELYRDAWRQTLTFPIVNRFYLPLNQIGNFLLPVLHGHPFFGTWTARGNFWETCCYLGVIPCVLLCFGMVSAWQRHVSPPFRRPFRFWTGVFVAGLWMALGGGGGLYHLAWVALPGFRSFHDPARCLVWSAWAASGLVAFGWQTLAPRFRRAPSRGLFCVLLSLTFLDLAHFGRTLYPLGDPHAVARLPAEWDVLQDDPAFKAHQARLLSPDSARVWQRFTRHRSYQQTVPDYLPLWADTLISNLPLRYGVPDAYGYEPVARHDAQIVSGTAALNFRPEAVPIAQRQASAWAGMLGVRTLAFFRIKPPETIFPELMPLLSLPTLPPLHRAEGRPQVYLATNPRWQPRARLTSHFVVSSSRANAIATLLGATTGARTFNPATTTLIVGEPGFAATSDSRPGNVTIITDTPDFVRLQMRNASPCLLVLADTLHPGWRATVDGRSCPILSADGFLRAMPLPTPGEHRVTFQYRPTSFLLGWYLSLLTLTGLIAWRVGTGMKKDGVTTIPAGVFDKRTE